MGIIRELPKGLVEKIAAGEVVERPASVVKELVENSIDAGAQKICVDISEGGKGHIAVMDDGRGMEPVDVGLCVVRHASSKISSDADLMNIRTMGFRGEALAAIGAVSRLSVESKLNRPDILEGSKIDIEGGLAGKPSVVGCPGGTKIIVSDLFFNVPARKKFLRSSQVEYGHISECVMTFALAYPEIRFELIHGGKRAFVFNAGDIRSRMIAVMGSKALENALSVDEEVPSISVKGFVSEFGRAAGKDVHIFLNKRPVRDRLLMHAVTQAFGERLHAGQYPASVLWLSIDPSKVDVNVHPAKREVKFAESGVVHDFIMCAVRKVISAAPAKISATDVSKDFSAGVEKAINRFEEGRLLSMEKRPMSFLPQTAEKCISKEMTFSDDRQTFLRPLGQFASTYIVCEDPDGTLVLIDQHAAHERLGFDELKRQYAAGSVHVQRLLVPEIVELGDKGVSYITEHSDSIAAAGFEVENFGGGSLVVKSVPALLGGLGTDHLFHEVARELEEFGGSHTVDQVVEHIFAVIACHRQVRGGDRLAADEISRLVSDVERENVTTCPHGRPAVVKIEKGEIEKWFKRTV